MYNNSKVAKAIRLAMMFGAGAAASIAAPAFSADEGAEDVERIEVTGSRIKRVDMEGPSPVQVFDKDYLESTGTQTVADFLFQSSFAGPGLTTENATLAQGAGAANFDARGFGSAYTVFLVNGRRLPGSPTGGDASADLNQIPMAAVERIEFLADGASAIYGADAVSGVINIITKTDFEGLSVKAQYGQALEHGDGGRTSFEVVAGTSTDKSSTLLAFDYFKQEVVWAKDRPLINSATSVVTGEDGRSPTGFPGTWLETDFSDEFPVEGCPEESIRPTTVAETGTECAYDFAPLYQAIPYSERMNVFASHNQELTDSLTGYVEARYSRSKTKVRNGAAPGFFFVPESATENSFGRDMYMIRRTVDAGPRSRDGVNSTFNVVAGLDYAINDDHLVNAYYSKSWVNNNQMGMSGNISKSRLSDAVEADLISLVNENPAHLWTLQPHETADGDKLWVAIPTHRQGELTEEIINLGLSGSFDVLEGIGYAVGVEQREEGYFDYTDIAQIEADVAGGAASFGIGGRTIKSAYSEVSVMPIEAVEISMALRYDDIETTISDIGSKVTDKFAISWRPTDNLLLRASRATGFKAPTLGDLFLGESFGVNSVIDTKACDADPTQCSKREARVKSGGNPELEPEESTSYNLGVSYEAIDNLNLTVDYWNLEVEGKIGSLGAQEILNNEAQLSHLVNRVGGNLYHPDAFIETNLQNLTLQQGNGVDINADYSFDLAGGTATFGAKVSNLLSMERQSSGVQPLCEDKGTTSEPEWRTNLRASWETDDYGMNVSLRYVGETVDNPAGRKDGSCESKDATKKENVDSYTQVDMQGFYYLPTGTKLTVGMRNVFDEAPVYSSMAGGGWPWYDQALYDNMGRFGYISLSHKF